MVHRSPFQVPKASRWQPGGRDSRCFKYETWEESCATYQSAQMLIISAPVASWTGVKNL